MEKRFIKENNVSLLGMGCMRLPMVENTEEIDYAKTEEMIDLEKVHTPSQKTIEEVCTFLNEDISKGTNDFKRY